MPHADVTASSPPASFQVVEFSTANDSSSKTRKKHPFNFCTRLQNRNPHLELCKPGRPVRKNQHNLKSKRFFHGIYVVFHFAKNRIETPLLVQLKPSLYRFIINKHWRKHPRNFIQRKNTRLPGGNGRSCASESRRPGVKCSCWWNPTHPEDDY